MKRAAVLTIDGDILLQVEVLDSVAQCLNVQLALKMPDKFFGVQHVCRKLGESSRVCHSEAASQVQGTASTTISSAK